MLKKIMSFTLSLILAASCFTFSVSAAPGDSASDPFIYTENFDVVDNDDLYSKFKPVSNGGIGDYSVSQETSVVEDEVDFSTHGKVWLMKSNVTAGGNNGQKAYYRRYEETPRRDVEIEFDMRTNAPNNERPMVFLRTDARPDSGYAVRLGNETVALQSEDSGGGEFVIATVETRGESWHHYKITAIGKEIKVYRDDKLVLEYNEAKEMAGGIAFGGWYHSVWIDNLSVKLYGPSTPLYANNFEEAKFPLRGFTTPSNGTGSNQYAQNQVSQVVQSDDTTYGNVWKLNNGSSQAYYKRYELNLTDLVMDFDLKTNANGTTASGQRPVAYVRSNGNTNSGYAAQLFEDGIRIISIDSNETAVATGLYSAFSGATSRGTDWRHYRITAIGNVISAYRTDISEDVPIVSYTIKEADSPKYLGAGAIAFAGWNHESFIDNLVVASPSVANNTTVFDSDFSDDAVINQFTGATNGIGVYSGNQISAIVDGGAGHEAAWKLSSALTTKGNTAQANQAYYKKFEPSPLLRDVEVEFDLKTGIAGTATSLTSQTGERPSVYVRTNNNGDSGYSVQLYDNGIRIVAEGGSPVAIGFYDANNNRGTDWRHYKVTAIGDTISAYRTDISATDPVVFYTIKDSDPVKFTEAGGIAFGGWWHEAFIDNLKITGVSAAVVDEVEFFDNFDAYKDPLAVFENASGGIEDYAQGEVSELASETQGKSYYLGSESRNASGNRQAYYRRYVSEYLNLDLKFDLKTNADPSATEQTPFVYIRPPIGSSGDAGYVVMLFESKVEIWLGSTVLQTAELSPSRGNDWREYRITAVDKVLSVYRLDISEDDPIITYDGLNVVEGGGFGFGGWRHSVWIDNIEAKLWGTPPPAEFELNRTEARLSIGDAITLSPLYDDVRSKPSSFTFVSADETVATVDSAGVVYAKSEGTAVITATDRNTISRTCKITVNAPCNTFIYVSTTGDDLLGDGTEDNPFATIQRAQTEVRNLSSLPDGGVTVYLKGGWYYVDEPLQFAKEDSGEAGKPVVYASAPGGEKAAIHSGRTISGFRSLEENDKPVGLKDSVRSNVYVADVDPGWRFHDLYANGVRQQVARQINSSDYLTWNKFVRPIDKPFDQRTTNDGAAKGMELKFVTGDLNDLPNNGDLEVNYLPEVYWNSLAVLGDINAANGTARLRSLNPAIETGYWGNNVFSKFDGGGAYNIMNAPRDLDAAGEWCIDSKAGKVYWWPLNASDLESAVAPRAFELLRIQGSDKSRVEYLEFRNLNFMYTDRLPEDQWAEDPSDPKGLVVRNAENPDAAIFMQGVSNCVIADSAVIHTGSYAIALDHYAQNNLILRNNLEDLGCGGVQIYGYGPGITHPNNHNVVLGNYIKDVGLAPYQHSAAVTVYAAGYNDIKFNKFENMPYVAISIVGAAPDALGAGPSDTPVAGVSSFTDTFGNLGTQYGVQWDEIKATDAYTSGALKSRNLKAAQPLQGSSNNVAEYNIALEYALLMNDTGAYYSWSPGKGGEYNYSIARKTGKSKDMCWPFYLDDMSEDMKVEGNAVWAPQSNPHTKNQSTSVWKNNTWSNSETPAYTDLLAKIVAGASSLGKSFTKYGGDQLPSYALLVEGGAASATSSPDSAQITVTADNASFSKWELVDFIEGDSNLKYGTDSADAVDGLSLDDVKEKITTFLMPRHAVKLKAVAKSIPTKADLDYDIAEVVTDGKDILARTIFDGSAKSVPVEAKSAGLGEITVKYYELGGSDPVEPVDAGEYLVKVATVETTDFYAAGSKSSDGTEVPEIEIGLLVIEKATVLDISKEVFAREQLAKEYQQDLASLIPVDVASKGLEIAYAMSFSDTPGFLSNPSLDGSVLSLPVEATAYADGIKETVEVIVTIKNYKDFTISVIVKLSEKIAVTVDADAPDRDYNTQPYDGIGEPTFTDSAGNAVNLELPYTIDYYDSDGAKLSSAPTDAGSYKAVITVNHVDYCGSVEKPFKIKPAPVIITAAVVGGTYDGTPRTVSPTFADQSGDAVNPNFKVTYYQVIGEAETALGSAPSDAGEYKAVVLVEDDNYDGTRTVTFTIAKAKLTVTANNVTIRVGETVPATFDYVVDGFLDSESLVVAPVLTCAIANSNKPGSYLIIVSGGTAPANYEIGSRVNGTLLVTGKETVSITAAVVGGTYDGTPRTVSPTFVDQSGDTVNPNFIVTYYQVIGEAETALDSAPKDAGEYKAVVLVEDDDYEGTLSVAFTIAKAKLTVTAKDVTIGVGDPVPATFDYVVDGFLDSESLEEEPILSCSITNSNKPDSYPIVVTGGTAPANYEIEKWVNGTLLVTGKETVSITGAVVGGTYDGTPRTVSPTFADQSGDAVNPKFKVTYYQVIGEAETALDSAPSNAGEYKAVVLVDDDNYDGTRTVTFTIAKAKLTVTAKDVTIGVGETVPATFDYVVDGFLDGESLVDDPLLTCSITNSNKPDSYPIVVTGGTAPANYEIVSRVNGTLLVTGKGIATIKADVDGGTYNGLTRTVVPEFEDKDGTAINPKFIVTYYQVIGEAPTALASAPEDAGEYKAVVLVEDDDYEGTLSVAFTIAKAKLTVTAKDVTIGVGEIVPATFDYVVDGFLDGESLVVAPVLTCSITNSNKPDSYPIVVTGGTAPPNYEIESRVDGTLRVTGKAIATIKADLDGGTYDGTSRTVVPEFEDKDGKSINPKFKVTYYQVIDGADVEIDTAPKDAGEYKAVVLVEDDNYEGTRTVTFTIAKAKLTVKAKDVAIGVGDPLPADFGFEVEGFANGESLEEDPVLTCSITNSNKPGNYPIIVSGGTAPANYEIEKWVNGTLMVTGKETVSITADVVGGTYDGTPRTVNPTFADQSGVAVYPGNSVKYYRVSDGTEVLDPPSDAGDYKAVILVEDPAYEGSYEISFTIAKAKLTVTAKSVTISVGDPVPADFEYAVDGFVNGDSLEEEPVLTCDIVDSSYPESYPIIVTGGTAPANYEIGSRVNGTLLVTGKAIATIIADVVGGTYDGTPRTVNPTFADQIGNAINPGFKVTYLQILDGSEVELGSAPSDAGEYRAVVLVEDEVYDGTLTVTFTIAKAKLTVSAKDVAISVGDPVPTDFEFEVEGFVNGESLGEDPVLTCAIANSRKPGSYPIIVTGGTAPANYEIGSRVNGTLLVTGKEIATIKADVVGGAYDGTPRTVAPEFEDGDGKAINPNYIVIYYQTIDGVEVELDSAPSDAGEYSAAVLVEDDNYNGTLAVAFTIAKAKLKVKALDASISVGQQLPAFLYEVEGFANGESLAEAPVLSCPTAQIGRAGEYPIVVAGGTAPANYEIESWINGTLAIRAIDLPYVPPTVAIPFIPYVPVATPKPTPVDTAPVRLPADIAPIDCAEELHKLGLFAGTSVNAQGVPTYSLEKKLTRIEALALAIRLMGLEKEANEYTGANPFVDVPDWSQKLAAFAYMKGVTVGIDPERGLFGATREVSLQEFAAFLLRALGYSERNGDFLFVEAVNKAASLSVVAKEDEKTSPTTSINRNKAVLLMVATLLANMNGTDQTMLQSLTGSGAVSTDAAASFIAAIRAMNS